MCHDVNDINAVLNELEKTMPPRVCDGTVGSSSDILSNGCHELYLHIALFFNAMIFQDVSPTNLLLSPLVPLLSIEKKLLNGRNN